MSISPDQRGMNQPIARRDFLNGVAHRNRDWSISAAARPGAKYVNRR